MSHTYVLGNGCLIAARLLGVQVALEELFAPNFMAKTQGLFFGRNECECFSRNGKVDGIK